MTNILIFSHDSFITNSMEMQAKALAKNEGILKDATIIAMDYKKLFPLANKNNWNNGTIKYKSLEFVAGAINKFDPPLVFLEANYGIPAATSWFVPEFVLDFPRTFFVLFSGDDSVIKPINIRREKIGITRANFFGHVKPVNFKTAFIEYEKFFKISPDARLPTNDLEDDFLYENVDFRNRLQEGISIFNAVNNVKTRNILFNVNFFAVHPNLMTKKNIAVLTKKLESNL